MLVQDDQRSMTKSIRRTVEVKVREETGSTYSILFCYSVDLCDEGMAHMMYCLGQSSS